MRLRHPDGSTLHLSYCTNVHPADDLGGVIAQLDRHSARVRERLGEPVLGIGLWLAAPALGEPDAAPRLREALKRNGLEVVTLNGFPYTAFHADVVKRDVYVPNWSDPARREYTVGLAELLAEILPGDVDEGSISTVPLGWRDAWDPEAARRGRDELLRAVEQLETIRDRTGRTIRIAVEPEPGCTIETIEQAVDALADLAPEWIGICLDACHLAVQFESPEEAVIALDDAGLEIYKAQVSSALRVDRPASPEARELLGDYAEPRFLHQVRERVNAHIEGVDDLPDALAGGLPGEREWRVHFHVPVNTADNTTQADLERTLAVLCGGSAPRTRHLDIETYTWSVLPGDDDTPPDERLVAGIADELAWTRDRLVDLGAKVG